MFELRSFLTGLLLLLILLSFIPATNAEILYNFDIDANGGAWYLIEYRTLLDSQEKIDEFNNFKQIVESNNTHKSEFEKRMRDIVTGAGIATSRPMNASEFTVSAINQDTATGNFGIVRYTFKWAGFALISDSSIIIGDVFFGGQHISTRDSFIIKIPEGYEVSEIEPTPDIQRDHELIWMGPYTFNSGKPGVVFSEKRLSYSYWPAAVILLVLALGGGAFLFWKRNTKKYEIGPDNADNFEPGSSEVVRSSPVDFESDEEWIIFLINEHGGSIMQSEIVSYTHFSKSKTSALLAKMAEDGLIERVKKGRENLIRLAGLS